MKTKLYTLITLFVLLIQSSYAQNYLSSYDNVDEFTYGSYINIELKSFEQKNVKGELIAVDSNQIIVLNDSRCIVVPIKDILGYKIRYAKQEGHYGWSIPLYSLATVSHGFFLLLTFPINLASTISITVRGINAFTYNERKISYEELKMFARFPQGLPPNISLTSIK